MTSRLSRAWRSPAFRIQALALLIAALVLTTLLQMQAGLEQRFNERTATTLGGDLVLSGSRAPEPAQEQKMAGVNGATVIDFASVLIHKQQFLLASVRAVSPHYPLYGELLAADRRLGPGIPRARGPAPGNIWLAGTALDRLGLEVGDHIALGQRQLRLTHVIVKEPDQQRGFYSMNPAAMINLADLPGTGVLATGSRYRHTRLLSGDGAIIARLRKQLEPGLRADQQLRSARDPAMQQQGPLRQLFLWSRLAVLLVLMLCTAALYLAAQVRSRQQRTLIAVMKTVGASRRQLMARLIGSDMLPLLMVAAVGAGLAVLASMPLLTMLGMPMSSLSWRVLAGWLGPMLLWAGAAMPMLWQLWRAPAGQLLGDHARQSGGHRTLTAVVLALLLLAGLLSGSVTALWPLVLMMLLAGLGLPLLLWPLMRLADQFSDRLPLAPRLGLRRLSRRQAITLPLLASLSLALAVISLSMQNGHQLVSQWRGSLPQQAPNYFVINLFEHDLPVLRKWLHEHGARAQPLYPISRARLTAINDEPVRAAVSKESDRAERALNRDLSLTEAQRLPDSNKVTTGRWVRSAGEVSVEARLAESLGIVAGDTLTFTGSRGQLNARVVGLREVNWESFSPNFYFMFGPGSLADQDRTWLTSFYLPKDDSGQLAGLVQQMPQISLLDVNALLNTLQNLIRQASQAALALGVALLLAALLVLLAAWQAGHLQRREDNRLLVILGGQRALLRRVSAWQAAFLAISAALLANLVHLAALWPLGQLLFDGQVPLTLWLLLPWALAALLVAVAALNPGASAPRQAPVTQ
ncbi:MAG: FtsX-like permease family protein [Alcanivorax sp.]|nr:FtsX-like permease family protein [Alcanivorax sp.]